MRKVSSAIVLALLLGRAGTAGAQQRQRGFAVDRYDPAERGSEWFALDSLDLRGHGRPALGITADEGYHPLVAYDANGKYVDSLVRNQLWIDPSASLVLFDRLRLGATLPLAVSAGGKAITTSTTSYTKGGSGLGDLRLAADLRLFGTYRESITGALGAALYLPTGARDKFTSDGNVRFAPRFSVAGDSGVFTYSGRVAFHYRPLTERFDHDRLGSQLELAAAGGLRLDHGKLVVGPEVSMSTILGDAFTRRGTPVEALLGAHYTCHGFRVGAGAGAGLTEAWGSPAFRGLISFEWAPAFEEKKPPPLPPPPPPEPEPPPLPPPPPPPPDRDNDGIEDAKDACPDQAGVANNDATANGCPPDRDGDGISDREDACPDAPGPGDPEAKRNGCPLARIEDGQIKIAEQVRFKSSSAEILPESDPLLLAIASTLKIHPEIMKLGIEGHTDNTGTIRQNLALSQKRAAAVAAALVKNGVDKKRLEAKGIGGSKPLDSNQTPEGRTLNRRVELYIVEVTPR